MDRLRSAFDGVVGAVGAVDVGQAVIVQQGLVLGVEAIEGTDALIERCGKLRREAFFSVMAETTATTALIYGLIFGAQVFSFFVGVSALTESAIAFVAGLDWSPLAIMALILVLYLLLGSLMESFAVMVITVPILATSMAHTPCSASAPMLCHMLRLRMLPLLTLSWNSMRLGFTPLSRHIFTPSRKPARQAWKGVALGYVVE